MTDHPSNFRGSVTDALREAVTRALPDAQVEAQGGGGHFTLSVRSRAFEGKSMVESHRLVYSAIAHLMQGDAAPVHAIDSLQTRVP
jgi:stress-induced morphogen